jgi:GTP cyclohydrolase I
MATRGVALDLSTRGKGRLFSEADVYHREEETELNKLEYYAEELIRGIVGNETFDESDHFMETPRRLVAMLQELTTSEEFNFTTFESDHDEMIIVSPIPFYSLCAHHTIPFFGEAHVAYIPQGRIAGLSKIARVVKYYSRGLWVQEDLSWTIAEVLEEVLKPIGTSVIMKAEHLCMTMRGVQSPGTKTTTSIMRGVFLNPEKRAREEFLRIIAQHL